MKTILVCLANSIKYGGRCLAGIELTCEDGRQIIARHPNGAARWLRPISRAEHGELSVKETAEIKLLDLVEIEITEFCPTAAHRENVRYASLKKIGQYRDDLAALCDAIHPTIFFDHERSLATENFHALDYSLMLVKPERWRFSREVADYPWERPKFRVEFLYQKFTYKFPLTDPIFCDSLKRQTVDTLSQWRQGEAYFTLSLSEEFNGRHYKLAAGILPFGGGAE
jgi:hypothetical protein